MKVFRVMVAGALVLFAVTAGFAMSVKSDYETLRNSKFLFLPTLYHTMAGFLSTYWAVGKIVSLSLDCEYLEDRVLLVEQRRVELLASALRIGLSAKT